MASRFPLFDISPLVRSLTDVQRALSVAAGVGNSIRRGKLDAIKSVTLTENSDTTTVTDERLTYFSGIYWEPTTTNAQAELATGIPVATTRKNGQFVFTHQNNAQTDRTFNLLIIG